MTDFALPPFIVDYGGWWIDVDLHGDLLSMSWRRPPGWTSRRAHLPRNHSGPR